MNTLAEYACGILHDSPEFPPTLTADGYNSISEGE